jgi:putative ABC transport system permease protein
LLYGLLGLAIVIAVLGIVNTQALSVIERRREIGMLRAIGMQRKQVRRTVYLESLLIASFGAVLGVTLGVAYGVMFARTLHDQGLNVISVPWGQAVLFLLLAGLIGVLAALWPGFRAARTPALEAIATSKVHDAPPPPVGAEAGVGLTLVNVKDTGAMRSEPELCAGGAR